jgi:protein O-mannosyl-transferase
VFVKSQLVTAAVGLCLLTILTFWPVHRFGFVQYDDIEFVVENPHVRTGLTAANVRWAFQNPYSRTGGPLTWLSHMIDIELYGLIAGGHHVTNLVFHVASALLLLFVLWRMTGSTWRSAFVAALFAVHPLHVESVAWIAERKDVLSGFFWFATIGAYTSYVRRGGRLRYAAVLALFVLGLMSKPMIVTLPFVLLLLDIWPLQRLPLDRWRARLPRLVLEKLPLIVLGGVAILLTLLAQQEAGAVSSFDVLPLSGRITNAAVSYIAYLVKTVWPADLIPFYPYRRSISPTLVTGCVLMLLVLSAAAVRAARRAPYVTVGWCWFVATLVPVIGLVQVGGHAMADRFTYLPLVGIFLVVSWGGAAVLARIGPHQRGTALCATVILVACAFTARAQAMHWRDGLALWEHTVRVDPDNARAYSNLGVVLAGLNRRGEAIAAYRRSLHLQPGVPQTLTNLGLELEAAGRSEEAIPHYAEAARIAPTYVKPRLHLATLLAVAGRTEEAISYFQEAIRLEPRNSELRVNLAVTLGRSGRPMEALPHMLEAVRLEPKQPRWRYFAAVMLVEAGHPAEAIPLLEGVLTLDPHDADARRLLGDLRSR